MTFLQFLNLILIAALWGGSHVMLRVLVPAFGAERTALMRIGLGALTLIGYASLSRIPFQLKQHIRLYVLLAILNSALPLSLFAFASVHLPASYLVILNGSTPLFAAIFGSLFLSDRFTLKKLVGVFLGIAGVFLVARGGSIQVLSTQVLASFGFGLAAAASYALGGVSMKKWGETTNGTAVAAMSNFIGFFLVLPFAPLNHPIDLREYSVFTLIGCIAVLGCLCTGVAFAIFYKLLKTLGPFRASLVTFLIPVFGLIWGVLFLGEAVTLGMLIGMGIILAATAMLLLPQSKK